MTMDAMRMSFALIFIVTTCGAMAKGATVGVDTNDSLLAATNGGGMACQIMSREMEIAWWIRKTRETNDASVAFDSIIRLGYLHRADWDGANEYLKEACRDIRTAEGDQAVELQKRKIRCMQMAYDHIARNINGSKLATELRGARVVRASEEGVILHYASQEADKRVAWATIYKDCYKEYIGWVGQFLAHRNKRRMPLYKWAETMSGAILTMKHLSVDDAYVTEHIERWIEEVVNEFPDYQRYINAMITDHGLYIHASNPHERMFANAWRESGGDIGSAVLFLCEQALTKDTRLADDMIRCLGVYGTPAQLPFLYSMTTNVQHGASAVGSIMRLEGLTSNLVNFAGAYLSMTNASLKLQADVCKSLLSAAANTNMVSSARQCARDMVYRYALRANGSVMYIDYVFTTGDSSYRFSKRRLAVMRSVSALGVHPSSASYVTNAINELVAYPEANLPE